MRKRCALEPAELAGEPRELAQPVLGDEAIEGFLAVGYRGHSTCSPWAASSTFANQALAAEHLVPASLAPGVHAVPDEIDRDVARLKLASLGVEVDVLSEAQRRYVTSWA